MSYKNITQKFGLKNIDYTRNYLIEEVNQKELMNQKQKKVCRFLNYTEHLLILIFTVFFSWYFYSNYEFCNIIKNLCTNCRNYKFKS